jgi:hypothetical protein
MMMPQSRQNSFFDVLMPSVVSAKQLFVLQMSFGDAPLPTQPVTPKRTRLTSALVAIGGYEVRVVQLVALHLRSNRNEVLYSSQIESPPPNVRHTSLELHSIYHGLFSYQWQKHCYHFRRIVCSSIKRQLTSTLAPLL